MFAILNETTGAYLAFTNSKGHYFVDGLDCALHFGKEVDAVKKIGTLVSSGVMEPDFSLYTVMPITIVGPSTPPAAGDPLTFGWFQYISRKRNEKLEELTGANDWTHGDWGNALAGEAGEACNVIKKIRRGWPPDGPEGELIGKLASELGDVVAYATLIADRFGIDLGEAVANKFNEVSERLGVDFKV